MLMWREMFAPNGELLADTLAKLCFGTDMTYFIERHGFQPYIDFYERLFDEVRAPAELREQVNAGNLLSLFGVEGLC